MTRRVDGFDRRRTDAYDVAIVQRTIVRKTGVAVCVNRRIRSLAQQRRTRSVVRMTVRYEDRFYGCAERLCAQKNGVDVPVDRGTRIDTHGTAFAAVDNVRVRPRERHR